MNYLERKLKLKKAEPKKQKFDLIKQNFIEPIGNYSYTQPEGNPVIYPQYYRVYPNSPPSYMPSYMPSYNDYESSSPYKDVYENQLLLSSIKSPSQYMPYSPPLSPVIGPGYSLLKEALLPESLNGNKQYSNITEDEEIVDKSQFKIVGNKRSHNNTGDILNNNSLMVNSTSLFTNTPQNNIINSKKDEEDTDVRHSWNGFDNVDLIEHSEAEDTIQRHSWSGW